MNIHPNTLAARCAAFNRANTEANRLAPLYLAALAPFVGKQVIKAAGGFLEKVKAVFPKTAHPDTPGRADGCTVWESSGAGYSLTFTVKTCELSASRSPDCQIGNYAEACVYVAELSNGVLTKLCPLQPRRTDYSPDQIAALRKEAERTREAARNAESACHPFGLFDR